MMIKLEPSEKSFFFTDPSQGQSQDVRVIDQNFILHSSCSPRYPPHLIHLCLCPLILVYSEIKKTYYRCGAEPCGLKVSLQYP